MPSAESTSVTAGTTSVGPRLFDYAASELTRAIACLGWKGGRLHTGVHQARKSIRRTRSTLALGMPALGPGALLIDRELRRINHELSTLRDSHAMVVTMDGLLARVDDPATGASLRRVRRIAAQQRAALAREVLAADPALHGRRALLLTLQAALPSLLWSSVSAADVAVAIERSAERVDVAGERAQASFDEEHWHAWRRRVRRLSQQHRALGDESGELSPHEKRSKRLAIHLGEAQDYALIIEHCGKRSPFADVDRRLIRGVMQAERQRVRDKVSKLLARLPTTVEDAVEMTGVAI